MRSRRSLRSGWWLPAGVLLVLLAGVLRGRPHPAADAVVPSVAVGMTPYAAAVDVPAHRVVVLNAGSNSVSLLDAVSGRLLRTVPVGSSPTHVAVDALTHRAFVLTMGDNSVSMVDTIAAAVPRTVHLAQSVDDVAVDEESGHVFIATTHTTDGTPNTLLMLDARTGAVLHTAVIDDAPGHMAVDARTQRVFLPTANAVDMLDARSGRMLRRITVGSGPLAGPVSVAIDERSGHAFVVNTSDFTVSMLDARTGRLLRTVPVGANPWTLAVDTATERVFVVNRGSSTVSMLDARSGAVVRTIPLGSVLPTTDVHVAPPIDVVVDERRGRAFVINGSATDRAGHPLSGNVSVLDARSGQPLRRLPVGLSPLTLALDETTGHLFVVNMNGEARAQTAAPDPWGWVPAWLRQWGPWHHPTLPPTKAGSVTVLSTAQG